jgi:hypothetical protein
LNDNNSPAEIIDEASAPRVVARQDHPISRSNISSNALKVLYRLKGADADGKEYTLTVTESGEVRQLKSSKKTSSKTTEIVETNDSPFRKIGWIQYAAIRESSGVVASRKQQQAVDEVKQASRARVDLVDLLPSRVAERVARPRDRVAGKLDQRQRRTDLVIDGREEPIARSLCFAHLLEASL